MKNLLFAAFAVLILGLNNLAQSADVVAAAGTFDGQQYVNKSLGLTVLAPGGWTFFPYTRNAELVAKNRATNRDLAAINTQVLFQATPPKQFGGENSAILSAGIEKLTKTQTSQQYASTSRDTMAAAGLTLTRDITEVALGNSKFSTFEVSGTVKSLPFRQMFFVNVRKNIAIFFVETFYDNKNTFAVEAALKTLKFR